MEDRKKAKAAALKTGSTGVKAAAVDAGSAAPGTFGSGSGGAAEAVAQGVTGTTRAQNEEEQLPGPQSIPRQAQGPQPPTAQEQKDAKRAKADALLAKLTAKLESTTNSKKRLALQGKILKLLPMCTPPEKAGGQSGVGNGQGSGNSGSGGCGGGVVAGGSGAGGGGGGGVAAVQFPFRQRKTPTAAAGLQAAPGGPEEEARRRQRQQRFGGGAAGEEDEEVGGVGCHVTKTLFPAYTWLLLVPQAVCLFNVLSLCVKLVN